MIDQLLNAYWLRPETALWRCIDIEAMKDFKFVSPSLDIGCGDGIFSFIRAGGELDVDFDVFQSVGNLENYFDKADVFDNYDEHRSPTIVRAPEYQIDYALDHKENLMKKANTLGLYGEMVLGDANQGLPFDGDYFGSIFSNIVYWLDDPFAVLADIHRVLKPGGRCCLMLPNSTLPKYSFYNKYCVEQQNQELLFLEALDRGRSLTYRHAKSANEWIGIIKSVGFEIVTHNRHLSKTVVQIWDIGLRPLFPVLSKMAVCAKQDVLSAIKKEWVEIFKRFLEPLAAMDERLNQGEEPAFHCFILEKVKGRLC